MHTNIEQSIADTIIERPYGFKVDGRRFFLYPITLGKTFLLRRLITRLEVNEDIIKTNPFLEALRLVSTKKEDVCRLISYHTFKDKDELFDNDLVEERMKHFQDNLDDEELAQLLITVLTPDDVNTFIKHLKIDKEKEAMNKVLKCKKDTGNNYTFGGNSIYGTLIDTLCERYHWTMDYVVWGISYSNIQMLMSDRINSVYLTDEEKKRCKVSNDRTVISGDDIKNIDMIKRMFS